MNYINSFKDNLIIKYFRGLIAIAILWLLPTVGIFVFDSCKKTNYDRSKAGEAAKKFNEVLGGVQAKIGSIHLSTANSATSNRLTDATTAYYLDFPNETNPEIISDFSSNVTIQSLRNVLENQGVSIDQTFNANAEVILQIAEEPIRQSLQPLVVEAKNYLYSKGVSEQDIATMLREENAEEIDLIPFVKILSGIEQEQYAVRSISLPLINTAKANNFLECGIEALGFDAAYALGHSGASSWTWSTMRSVFKGVAKRFLGPIGVAIAIVSFTTCML